MVAGWVDKNAMEPTFTELKGKTVVITGGGGVLCSAMGKELARQGARVVLLDLLQEKAGAVAREIEATGGEAMGIGVNVLEKKSLEEARKEVSARFGTCDILINGAGGNHPKGTTSNPFFTEEELEIKELKTFFDLDQEGFQFVFDLNLTGTLLPTQVFARDMVGRSGSSIINISSMNASRPLTKIPAYSAAKAAVSNFTQWLAVHFSQVNIRVNALAPGFFVTEQNRRLLMDENEHLTERGQAILAQTPMRRFGQPEDLMGTLLWLCSNGAAFVTGVVVPVDGGFDAYSGV